MNTHNKTLRGPCTPRIPRHVFVRDCHELCSLAVVARRIFKRCLPEHAFVWKRPRANLASQKLANLFKQYRTGARLP